MNKTSHATTLTGMIVGLGVLVWISAVPAATPVNWDAVSGRNIMLFSPGQSGWEWILTGSDHSASKSVRKGTPCLECHEGEQAKMGKLIGSGKKIEPQPVAGNPGSIPVKVKFAQLGDRLYVRLSWQETPQHSSQDHEYRAKVAMMFNDGTVKATKVAGCWSACHLDLKGMPTASGADDLSMYLFASRSKIKRTGGGKNFKPAAALAALMKKAYFLELWQADLNPDKPAHAVDGYVLDKRHMNPTPAIAATSTFSDGRWVVEFSRKLFQSGSGRFALIPGKTYTVGFAIHDSNTTGRFHHVSFGYTFALDSGRADFVAKQP